MMLSLSDVFALDNVYEPGRRRKIYHKNTACGVFFPSTPMTSQHTYLMSSQIAIVAVLLPILCYWPNRSIKTFKNFKENLVQVFESSSFHYYCRTRRPTIHAKFSELMKFLETFEYQCMCDIAWSAFSLYRYGRVLTHIFFHIATDGIKMK